MANTSAEANVAAKSIFILLKMDPFAQFRATVVYTPSYLCRIDQVSGSSPLVQVRSGFDFGASTY
jgi:hypothetical protein